MKAVVKEKAGPGLALKELPIPEIKADEVLINVKTTSICGTDVHIYSWDSWAQQRIKNLPFIAGHEFAGCVVAVGKNVKRIRVGDFVSAETHIFCNNCSVCLEEKKHLCPNLQLLGVDRNGVFAEFITLPEKILWKNDPDLPAEIATLQEPLGNAVFAVLGYDKSIAGKNMLIFGDGPAGILSVAVAKALEASLVCLIGLSKPRLELGRKMGADFIINVSRAPGTFLLESMLKYNLGKQTDIVLEMSGSEQAMINAIKVVKPGGRISAFGFSQEDLVRTPWNQVVTKGIQIIGIYGRQIFDTWTQVNYLLQSGKLDISPFITHCLPFGKFEHGFELMRKRECGKIVLLWDNAAKGG